MIVWDDFILLIPDLWVVCYQYVDVFHRPNETAKLYAERSDLLLP